MAITNLKIRLCKNGVNWYDWMDLNNGTTMFAGRVVTTRTTSSSSSNSGWAWPWSNGGSSGGSSTYTVTDHYVTQIQFTTDTLFDSVTLTMAAGAVNSTTANWTLNVGIASSETEQMGYGPAQSDKRIGTLYFTRSKELKSTVYQTSKSAGTYFLTIYGNASDSSGYQDCTDLLNEVGFPISISVSSNSSSQSTQVEDELDDQSGFEYETTVGSASSFDDINIMLLNESFTPIALIDNYESAIWTDRYNSAGDFEIYVAASKEVLNLFLSDDLNDFAGTRYLICNESEHCMIVEDVRLTTDAESGNHIIITGRSLESILDRRIVWAQTTYSGTIETVIRNILNDSFISPSDSERKVSNFIFKKSEDSDVTKYSIQTQFTGDNVYDIVSDLCAAYNLGFKIVLDENNRFVFSLYSGKDRTYAQSNNPYVIFSPAFENLINSEYNASITDYRTTALVGGEGEGVNRRFATVHRTSVHDTGLNRREIFVNAASVRSETYIDGESVTLSDAEYAAQLEAKGVEKLIANSKTIEFDGQATNYTFVYGRDFTIGDVLQVENEYGLTDEVYISEYIISDSVEGLLRYPTFTKYYRITDSSSYQGGGSTSGGSGGTTVVYNYTGPYTVTPKIYDKTILPTEDKTLEKDVTVEEVPIYRTSNDSGTTVYIGSVNDK